MEVDEILNKNKAPQDGRNLLLAPSAKAQMLLCDKFVKAMERGDGTSPITTAQFGQILGFDTYLSQNVNSVQLGADYTDLAIPDAVPYAAEYASTLAPTALVRLSRLASTSLSRTTISRRGLPPRITDTYTLNEALKYPLRPARLCVSTTVATLP